MSVRRADMTDGNSGIDDPDQKLWLVLSLLEEFWNPQNLDEREKPNAVESWRLALPSSVKVKYADTLDRVQPVLKATVADLERRLQARGKLLNANLSLTHSLDDYRSRTPDQKAAFTVKALQALVNQVEVFGDPKGAPPPDPDAAVAQHNDSCGDFSDSKRSMTDAARHHGLLTTPMDEGPEDDRSFLGPEEPEWEQLHAQGMEQAAEGTYFSRNNLWTIKQLDALATKHRERHEERIASESNIEAYRQEHGLVGVEYAGEFREWEESIKGEVRKRLLRAGPPDPEAIAAEFVQRLVVVHIDVLNKIQERASRATPDEPAESVTYGYEMDSLVQNVAHLLKYRRCVKLAKLVYKRQGVGSLHDQYEAKLLNKELAHSHQDEGGTEMGIARRIIRQAHVSNYIHYTFTDPGGSDSKQRAAISNGKPNEKDCIRYYPEEYATNPPMAPIMCAAPPRMGKSHLTLLLASFGVKFGGHIEYGVAPNKDIPVDETVRRIKRLRWDTQGLRCAATGKSDVKELIDGRGGDAIVNINVYSQDEANVEINAMNLRIHKLASDGFRWVLHIRDEAQYVYKVADKINTALAGSFPIFYGLNMCVSATLLPACMETELVGGLNSVRQLLCATKEEKVSRSALEKYVILQPWSFPIGPDFLVPPSERFFGNTLGVDRYPSDFNAEDDGWYKEIYDSSAPPPRARPTNYYGTWLHVDEYQGNGVDERAKARHLKSEADVFIDDCLIPSRNNHEQMLKDPTFVGRHDAFSLTDAYHQYMVQFNKRNRKYYDDITGNIKADRGLRIANAPIHRLTVDAAWVMDHARTWMDEEPHVLADPPGGRIYPMLITAPDFMIIRRLEWVSLMLKVAWLRMHEDYMNNLYRDLEPAELKARYGVVVLVFQSNKSTFASMAAPEDVGPEVKERKVIAITFDPTLPENRFPMHAYPGLPVGTMEPSIFIPTITPKHYEAYQQLFMTVRERVKADSNGRRSADEVKPAVLFERLNALQFLLKGLPSYEAFKTNGQYERVSEFPKLVHRLYRFDMEDCWMRVDNPAQMERSERREAYDDEDRPNRDGYFIGGGFNDDTFSRGNNTEGCDNEPARQDAMQDPYANPPGSFGGGASNADGPQSPAAGAGARIENDPNEPYAIPPCIGEDGEDVVGPERRLPNMNAIALRLCISGYHNAQEAIRDAYTRCGIHKVAASGYRMFEAGLTLQTTFEEADGSKQMFVAKYVSFALRRAPKFAANTGLENPEHGMAPNLSVLYQMLGRGFADTKDVELPKDWKLNVLSREGVRTIVKLYGNTELLMSRFKNESIEGRKLALGSLLESIKDAPFDKIKTKFVGKKDTQQQVSQKLLNASTLNRLLSMDVAEVGNWPFHRMRDCLTGEHMRPNGAAGLTEAERALEDACSAFVPGTIDLQRHETPIVQVDEGDGGLTRGLVLAPFPQ